MTRIPRSVIAALAVGLLLRLAWLAVNPFVPPETVVQGEGPPTRGDDENYVKLAQSLIAGQGYQYDGHPQTHFMPGWPLLLALPLALGLGFTGARIMLCLLSTLVCLEAYLLADRLVSRRAGLVAAWWSALFPPSIWYASALLSETSVAALLGLWAIVAMDHVRKGDGPGRVIALGLLSGLLALFRAEMIVLAPLPFVARAVLGPWKQQIVAGTAAVVLTVGMLTPWAAYNQRRLGETIFLSTAGGLAIWTISRDPPFDWPDYQDAARRFTVPGRPKLTDKNYAREGMAIVRAHPWAYLRMRVVNLPRFWFGSQTEVVRGAEPKFSEAVRTHNVKALAYKFIGFGTQILYGVGGLLGLFLFARNRTTLLPWLIVGAKVAVHAPFVQTTRYSLHLAPLLLCYSGASLSWAIDTVRGRRRAPALAAGPSTVSVGESGR